MIDIVGNVFACLREQIQIHHHHLTFDGDIHNALTRSVSPLFGQLEQYIVTAVGHGQIESEAAVTLGLIKRVVLGVADGIGRGGLSVLSRWTRSRQVRRRLRLINGAVFGGVGPVGAYVERVNQLAGRHAAA